MTRCADAGVWHLAPGGCKVAIPLARQRRSSHGSEDHLDGILAPGRTPKPLAARIHAELVKMLNQADVKATFASRGMDVVASSRDEFAAYIRGETAKWTRVVKTIGIKPE